MSCVAMGGEICAGTLTPGASGAVSVYVIVGCSPAMKAGAPVASGVQTSPSGRPR